MTTIIFLTSAMPENINRNFNFFQRVWFLSRDEEINLTVLARKGADFSPVADPRAKIVHARLPGKLGLFLLAFRFLLFSAFTRCAGGEKPVLLTEPSILNLCGPLYKIFRYRWAVDVWDIPIRKLHFLSETGMLSEAVFRFKKQLLRFCFRFADLFIVSICPEFEFAFFGIPAGKVKIFSNAVFLHPGRPEKLSLSSRGNTPLEIIYVRGIFTNVSGLDILVQAFLRLTQTRPNCRLTLIGQIPPIVEPQVESLRSRKDVRFIPRVPHEELIPMIESAHVMVIPFRRIFDAEQLHPIKLFEAIMAGATLVVPELAGLCAVVRHERNGLVYTPDSPDALAATLARLYDDDPFRIRLAEHAYSGIGEFDCAKKNSRIIVLLKDLARSPVAS